MKIDTIHSVEMVGDTLRTPILYSIIKQIFNRDLSKTLIPDEFIARGCSFFSFINSRNKYISFSYLYYNLYLVQINAQILVIINKKVNVFLDGEKVLL